MIKELPRLQDFKLIFSLICGCRALAGPKYVMVDIINNCDLLCIMCFNHSFLLKKAPDFERRRAMIMDYETFASLLSSLYKIKTEFVGICGKGEPFLHPDIKKMLSLSAKYNFKIQIITNGIHIDKEIFDFLVSIKLQRLTFSIHAGDAKTYKAIHPLQEESLFDLLKDKLVYLKNKKVELKSRYPKVTITNVISRLNCHNLSGMADFAESVGAERICFKPLTAREETQEPLSLELEHINSIRRDLKILRNNIRLEHNIDEYLKYLADYNAIIQEHNQRTKNKICYIPWVRANITTDGKVIGCPYYGFNSLGDIAKIPFREIWNSAEYRQFRKSKRCPKYCLGQAVYPFVSIFNSINKVKNNFLMQKQIEREIMEPRVDAVNNELILTKVYGNSMYPTIKSGERVLVKKVLNKDLRRGDIVLIKKDLWKICQRIINMDREKGIFVLKGDFNLKKDEEVKAEVVLGKVVALVSKDKIHPLRFQNTLFYYFGISSIAFLKEFISFLLNRLYSFYCLRRVLKKLSFKQTKCFVAKTEEDRELFYSLYNFIPQHRSSFYIAEMILGFYGDKFVGKLWVLEDKATGNFWLWGPYVKVLYRARNVGSSLIKKAIDSLKNRDVKSAVYVDFPPSKALMMCFRKLGFLLSAPLKQKSF